MQMAHENRLYRELLKEPIDPAVGERLVLLYSSLSKQSFPWDITQYNTICYPEYFLLEYIIVHYGLKQIFLRVVFCKSDLSRYRDKTN